MSRALYGANADDVREHVDTLQLVRVHKVTDYIITHPEITSLRGAVNRCKELFNWNDAAADQAFKDTTMFMKLVKRKDMKGYILLALNALLARRKVVQE